MARRVFYSFCYDDDNSRVQQVKQMGVLEGQPILRSNEWEEVAEGGDAAIEKYVEDELSGKSCLVVLIGENTASREWVLYEIRRAWELGKGVLGVYVHGLKNLDREQSPKGQNPFAGLHVDRDDLGALVTVHEPPYEASTFVYGHIKENIAAWVDAAVADRPPHSA